MSGGATPNLVISLVCLRRTRELPDWCELSRHARSGQRCPRPGHGQPTAGTSGHRDPCINDASGVRTKAAPGGPGRPARCMSDGGIDAGEARGGEPPRRVSGGRCARSRRQPCAARCRRRRRRCPHRCGRDCAARCGAKCAKRSAGARARAEPAATHEVQPRRAEAMPAAGAAGEGRARRGRRRARRAAPARGDHGGPALDAVEPRHHGGGPATAGSEASRLASGARSERSERRREGYPPEGPRPRSGLGRVARSRSEGERGRWRCGGVRPKRNGTRRRMTTRPAMSVRLRPGTAAPECRASRPCRRGCR